MEDAINNLGHIDHLTLPPGWVVGSWMRSGSGYARGFHPVEQQQTQMVFSYRGHRLSRAATRAFRNLIDAAPLYGGSFRVDTRLLQTAPLNEVLQELGREKTFQLLCARLQRINDEPVLVVEGKYAAYDVIAQVIFVDTERTARCTDNAPVQEITVVAPTRDYYRAAVAARNALHTVRWKQPQTAH